MTARDDSPVRWHLDGDGVLEVVLDDPSAATNMITDRHVEGMHDLLTFLTGEADRMRGVVITSAKASFFSGPEFDASLIPTGDGAGDPYGHLVQVREQSQALAACPVPVAAVLQGSALGGGFELALAAHHRVGVSDPSIRWALPESTTGILPAGGGTVRIARMFGVAATVRDVVGGAHAFDPDAAREYGLIDQLAATTTDAARLAREWVLDATSVPSRKPPVAIGPEELSALHAEIDQHPPGTARVLREICDVAVLACETDGDEAFAAETEAFRRLVALPAARQGGMFFAGLKRIYDRIANARQTDQPIARPAVLATERLPINVPSGLVDVFLPGDPTAIEIRTLAESASAAEIDQIASDVASDAVPIILREHQNPDPLDQAVIDVLRSGLQ